MIKLLRNQSNKKLFKRFYNAKNENNYQLPPTTYVPEKVNIRMGSSIMETIQNEYIARYDKLDLYKKFIDTNSKNKIVVGDLIKVELYQWLSDKSKTVTYTGECIDIHKTNVSSNFTIKTNVMNSTIIFKFPIFTPLIKNVILISRGNVKETQDDPKDYLLEIFGVKRRFH